MMIKDLINDEKIRDLVGENKDNNAHAELICTKGQNLHRHVVIYNEETVKLDHSHESNEDGHDHSITEIMFYGGDAGKLANKALKNLFINGMNSEE